MSETIEDVRKRIDIVDEEIVRQLNSRANLVLEVRGAKKAAGQPYHDPERELRVLNKVMAANQGPLDNETIKHLYRHILQHMREFQAE